MAKTTMDYKTLKYEQMMDYLVDNKDKLIKKDKDLYVECCQAIIKGDRRNPVAAKPSFYKLTKDFIDFENEPGKNKKEKDKKALDPIKNILKELGY
jgi:hypothetical protein